MTPKYFCDYCNKDFDSAEECDKHEASCDKRVVTPEEALKFIDRLETTYCGLGCAECGCQERSMKTCPDCLSRHKEALKRYIEDLKSIPKVVYVLCEEDGWSLERPDTTVFVYATKEAAIEGFKQRFKLYSELAVTRGAVDSSLLPGLCHALPYSRWIVIASDNKGNYIRFCYAEKEIQQ